MSKNSLRKESVAVLVKVHLNHGLKKNKDFLSGEEMRILDKLIEAEYAGIVNKEYSYLTPKSKVIENASENFISMTADMFELGYKAGRDE
jgi:hypothetical protein